MTERCSRSISPDSITGMIFCLEGIRHTVVLLNGPMGCKFYHSTTSEYLTYHPSLYLPAKEGGEKVPVDYNFLNDWFFRQSRVPCTYLDSYDFVYGSAEKVREALSFLKENVEFDLVAIVNSPGASLIGDNLAQIAAEALDGKPCVILESPGLSESFAHGYDHAFCELLKQVYPQIVAEKTGVGEHPEPVVNILGMSIFDRYAEGDRLEIERLLKLCGIRVGAFLGCESTLDDLRLLAQADLNVALYAGRTAATVNQLRRMGISNVMTCAVSPIGFDATHAFVKGICDQLGLPLSEAFIRDEERARARAFSKIDNVYQLSGLPNGTTFTVKGSDAQVEGFRAFLEDYLGMIFCPDEDEDDDAELVFGDANVIASRIARGKVFCGVEINNPQMGYVDLIPKTHLGIRGSLFIIEQVLSGLMSRI